MHLQIWDGEHYVPVCVPAELVTAVKTDDERVYDLLTLQVLCAQYPEAFVNIQRNAGGWLPIWLHGKCALATTSWVEFAEDSLKNGDSVTVGLGFIDGLNRFCDRCGKSFTVRITGE
jgi:hypothetical protein